MSGPSVAVGVGRDQDIEFVLHRVLKSCAYSLVIAPGALVTDNAGPGVFRFD